MFRKTVFQKLDEAYKKSNVVVICLWPESRAVGPIYGYKEPVPYSNLIKMMNKIMAAISPVDFHEYPSSHVFNWPLSHKAFNFIYSLESADSRAECEMILKQLGWENKNA